MLILTNQKIFVNLFHLTNIRFSASLWHRKPLHIWYKSSIVDMIEIVTIRFSPKWNQEILINIEDNYGHKEKYININDWWHDSLP